MKGDNNTIRWNQDSDGIVTLTLDDPSQRANTMNQAYQESMKAAVDRLYAEKDSITGVIITSAKDTFFAGGDLRLLSQVNDENAAPFSAGVAAIKADLRRLETLGKPVVAALNGAALGGGLEIALACHHRIALDNPKSQFGLPEVTLGLLPGGGGVTRITRLLGIADGLMKVLLQGTRHKPAQAVDVGIVDAGGRVLVFSPLPAGARRVRLDATDGSIRIEPARTAPGFPARFFVIDLDPAERPQDVRAFTQGGRMVAA